MKVSDEVKIRGFDTLATVNISVRGGDDDVVLKTLQTLRGAVEESEADLDLEGLPDGVE